MTIQRLYALLIAMQYKHFIIFLRLFCNFISKARLDRETLKDDPALKLTCIRWFILQFRVYPDKV